MSDWRDEAACLTEDPELFWPIGVTGPAIPQIEKAIGVCLRCPVRAACLQWAMDHRQEFGIWGGMTEDERRAKRVRDARIRRGEVADGPPAVHVDPGPSVELLQAAVDAGTSLTKIGELCGISPDTASRMLTRSKASILQSTAKKIAAGLAPVAAQ